jgi:hypothetical protein
VAIRRVPIGFRRAVTALAVVALALGPVAATGAAAGAPTMTARVLLEGHARVGSWMAIAIDLANDGPQVRGELRMDGGSQGQTRFSMPIDLPTNSRQTYVLHAQPPAFGRSVKVDLVSGDQTVASTSVAYLVHDAGQLVVGIVAERPQGIAAEIDLPASPSGAEAVVVQLTLADLPETVQGWAVLDRLVWQDVDSNKLSQPQLDALRGWLAGGGQMIIVGGTAVLATISAFPDDLLPYRPTATLDVAPASLVGLIGELPVTATDLPAMAGGLAHGHALLTSGDRTIAARMSYGSGAVTVVGFDPAAGWLAQAKGVSNLWRTLLPSRAASGPTNFGDDSNLLRAIQTLPAVALPPIGGLLILLAAYIVVIGPLNYLVLRRLDRREWAWVTMPLLVVGFAAAAYGYGSILRGIDLIVNQVAIVRGAPDATEATAQAYFAVFSPTRGSYRVEVPGGALLASPISVGFGSTTGARLDVVQGDPAAIRNLAVGFGDIRMVRAETATTAPRLRATLTLSGQTLTGTFENASDEDLDHVAIVLGGSVVVLGHVAAHQSLPVRLPIVDHGFGAALPDQIIGPLFGTGATAADDQIRYAILQQLTYDSNSGQSNSLDAEGPVVLAFSGADVLHVRIEGQQPRQTSNTLYYVPLSMAVHGKVTFASDLIRETVVSGEAMFFNKGGNAISMGVGTVTMAYRPIAFEGAFTPSALEIGLVNAGEGVVLGPGGKAIEPLPTIPVGCTDSTNATPTGCEPFRQDFLPDVEVFDLRTGEWRRLPRIAQGGAYSVTNPERYVDPSTGQVLVRFVNDNPDANLGFGFEVSISGDVR